MLVWGDSCQCTKLYNRTVITHVAETALPSLDSHDGSLRLNDAQTKSGPEAISAKVSVNYTSLRCQRILTESCCQHRSATSQQEYHEAQGTRQGKHPERGGAVERFVRFGSLDVTQRIAQQEDEFYLPQMMGQAGLYLEINLAETPEVESTMIAPASCSIAAATAERARVSAVSVGRGVRARSWSKRGG